MYKTLHIYCRCHWAEGGGPGAGEPGESRARASGPELFHYWVYMTT